MRQDQMSLAALAAHLHITPVPYGVFVAHCRSEAAKYPSSWWYRHWRLAHVIFTIGMMLCFIGAFVFGIATFYASLAGGIISATIAILILGGLGLMIRKTGRSVDGSGYWRERRCSIYRIPVPEPIKAIAIKIRMHRRLAPRMHLVFGWLAQNTVVLNDGWKRSTSYPQYYLVVRRDAEILVLGIWYEDGIVAQATFEDIPNGS